MVDNMKSTVNHRRGVRKTLNKTNDSNKTNDDLELGLLCSYQLIFLMESTLDNTKYIDIYKDAVEDMHSAEDQACNVIVIDHNRLVESLAYSCVEQDEPYRVIHERAKRYFNNNSRVSTKLMVLLVRQSIMIGLESMRQKWNFDTEPYTFQPAVVNIILTNFFDLEFLTEFIATKIKVDAIVKLSCREIAQTREKFVSRAYMAKQSMANNVIQIFWQDFHNWLNVADKASVFKNVVVYQYKSKYNANYEPPNVDKMLVMARKYIVREMNKVHAFIYNVRAEYEEYIKSDNPVYTLHVATVKFESYTKHLKGYPEDVIGLPTILDAMLKAITSSEEPTKEWFDDYFGALKNESDDGCMIYPVCVQYGNECGLAERKYNLRHTNYFDSTVNVLFAVWRKSLWGSRPFPPLDTEAEYDHIITDIKRQCECSGDDVDVQLCVLGINRLRNNLDVYRGELIGLPGLGQTNITFKPELIEPAGCATMVQMLQKQSENYKRMSHAYFEPEDVVLVGFYDCQKVLQTRKSSFKCNIPQRPVYAKDYFDLYYGKRTPKYFYAMDTDFSQTYTEETEELRFKDDDFLTISKRKWRFEPSTISVVYKSENYEIVKHIAVDDDQHGAFDDDQNNDDDKDWLRIHNNNAAFDYYIDKSRENVIRCIGRTADGSSRGVCTVGIISANDDFSNGMLQQSNQWWDNDDGVKVNGTVVEACRFYGNGRVVIKYEDQTTASYWASGKITSRTTTAEPSKSTDVKRKSSANSNNGSTTKSIKAKKSQSRKNARSVATVDKSQSRLRRKKSTISNTSNTSINKKRTDAQRRADYVERFSEDGGTRTVEFLDGTCITAATTARRSKTVAPPFEYVHPAYRTVIEDLDGTFHVAGLCSAVSSGSTGLRLIDRSVRIEATADAVYVYEPDDNGGGVGGDRLTAAFGWNSSDFLFEKRINNAQVVTVPRRRRDGDDLILGTTTVTATVAAKEVASECFIVKRGMSGIRTLQDGRRYKRFVNGVRGRQHTAVRENPTRIVTVFSADEGDAEMPRSGPTPAASGRYEWLQTPFLGRAAPENDHFPTTPWLTSRSLRKANVDYGPVLDALLKRRDTVWDGVADVRPAKLCIRVYVPHVDALRKMYAAKDRGNVTSSLRRESSASHNARLATKLAQLEQDQRDANEVRSLMRKNRFIPFFHAHDFGPLRRHLNANGL